MTASVAAAAKTPATRGAAPAADLSAWLGTQRINVERYAEGLRPFQPHEFGRGGAAPSEAHRLAANELLERLRDSLRGAVSRITAAQARTVREPGLANLQAFCALKEDAQTWVKTTERVWDFYFRLFTQRQTRLGRLLLGTDRIGLDCYQAIYTRLGTARPIPSPPPFTYVRSGPGPATYRRRVMVATLGRHTNPFPLIELPYHRLRNPWALGAVPHEVAHNIQADLDLWDAVPPTLRAQLTGQGIDDASAAVWARWHKEIFADFCGTLLIGPAAVVSLTGVLAGAPVRTLTYNPAGVHPTPVFRVLVNLELLRRMGFVREAERLGRLWTRIYPAHSARGAPRDFAASFARAREIAVEALCFTRYVQLGQKALADVVTFGRNEQAMVEEAAGRLATGTDPGIVPERFLIGAAHVAFARRLATPASISTNFYNALERR